jgi:hypothetical protein
MIKRFIECSIAAVCLACAFSASARLFATGASVDAKWTANGATACEKFLTPDVMSAILVTPSGTAVKDSATSCHRGAVYITLKIANVELFKQEMGRIVMTHPMTGVGDAAFWNQAGAMSSAKAPDRGCDMSVIGAPTKIKDAALGQKLGEICNTLFALK